MIGLDERVCTNLYMLAKIGTLLEFLLILLHDVLRLLKFVGSMAVSIELVNT